VRHPVRLSLAFSTTVLALAACSVVDEGLTDEELLSADVIVVAEDLRYLDPPTTLPAGQLRIALVNEGRAPHDLTVEGDLGTVVEVAGRGEAIADVDLLPGSYEIYCDVAGHREAGMTFEVTVS
jgi:uncharacterized cupredoxin-like copper-binding protein